MSDVRYVAEIVFDVKDSPQGMTGVGRKTDSIADAWKKLGSEVRSVGRGMSDAFTGAVEKAAAVGLSMAKIGVGAGIAAAAYGVGVLNNQLEATKVSIAAVLNAQGQSKGIESALSMAGGLVSKMRQDAKDLPGEFQDLLGIFQSGVGAAGNAGLDAVRFEKLAAHSMAAGKAMSVPLDQAGRELAQLLDGRAGAHNVFGSRLGIGKELNSQDAATRVKTITAALEKYEPAIKAFGNTFDAQSSTLIDNLKSIGGRATMPLFESMKRTLIDANRWFDSNQGKVNMWADKIGTGLSDAFNRGRTLIEEWWPAIPTFAENAYDKIVGIWKDARPHIESAAAAVKSFLQDEGSMDKIATVLKLYAGLKLGGGAADSLGGVASAGLGVWNAKQIAGIAAATGGTKVAGAATGAGAGVMAGGALQVAGQGALQFGLFEAAAGRSSEAMDKVTGALIPLVAGLNPIAALLAGGAGLVDRMYGDGPQNEELANEGLSLIRSHQDLGAEGGRVSEILRQLAAEGDMASVSLMQFAMQAVSAGDKLGAMIAAMPATVLTPDPVDYSGYVPPADLLKGKSKGGGGGGGTMKVEITINSNQAPGQIARAVATELVNTKQHATNSRRTYNFTRP
jgi:hypothetical protein